MPMPAPTSAVFAPNPIPGWTLQTRYPLHTTFGKLVRANMVFALEMNNMETKVQNHVHKAQGQNFGPRADANWQRNRRPWLTGFALVQVFLGCLDNTLFQGLFISCGTLVGCVGTFIADHAWQGPWLEMDWNVLVNCQKHSASCEPLWTSADIVLWVHLTQSLTCIH